MLSLGCRPRAGRRRIRSIGPELLSGASGNDPTNVGTAAAVGARTAYQLSWVSVLVGPMLYVVLAIAAQVAVTAGSDLQSLALKRYGRKVAAVLLTSVVIVNVVTIAADLQAGAAGIGLLTGADFRWLVLPLGAAISFLLLIGRYGQVVTVLKFLLPGYLAFTVAAILARPAWPSVLEGSLVPDLSVHRVVLAGALALLGTTLTSYVFVWETVQRGAEEAGLGHRGHRLAGARAGAAAGAVFTAVILWSMQVAAAATLGRRHLASPSAAGAARTLRPLAGPYAGDMFAAGLVISAVVALPVLIASTAYVIGAQFDWRRGLSQPVGQAGRFYAVLIAPIVLAAVLSLTGVPVLGMLVAASVIGGLGTPVGLFVLLRLARDRQIMGSRPISGRLAVGGWLIIIILCILGLSFIGSAIGGLG
jgi:Mn2+/Fe2+ NRAMP family transporter